MHCTFVCAFCLLVERRSPFHRMQSRWCGSYSKGTRPIAIFSDPLEVDPCWRSQVNYSELSSGLVYNVYGLRYTIKKPLGATTLNSGKPQETFEPRQTGATSLYCELHSIFPGLESSVVIGTDNFLPCPADRSSVWKFVLIVLPRAILSELFRRKG